MAVSADGRGRTAWSFVQWTWSAWSSSC